MSQWLRGGIWLRLSTFCITKKTNHFSARILDCGTNFVYVPPSSTGYVGRNMRESKKTTCICEINQGSWREFFIFQLKEKWKNKLNRKTIEVDNKNSHSLYLNSSNSNYWQNYLGLREKELYTTVLSITLVTTREFLNLFPLFYNYERT